MAWQGVITDNGRNMLTEISGGDHVLTITGATVGSGYVEGLSAMRAATALQSEKGTASVISKKYSGTNTMTIKTRIHPDNSGGYIAHEVGLWAKVDSGTEKLFALHQDTGDGVPVPDESLDPEFSFSLWMVHALMNYYTSGTVTIATDLEAYAKIEDIEDAVETLVTGPASSIDANVPVFDGTTGKIIKDSGFSIGVSVPANAKFTDTKNTAGSNNLNSKLYLIGAQTQASNPTTYSNSKCYILNGYLYSDSKMVSTSDTKNTAGSTQNTGKLFLIGAASQGDYPQTYSRSSCYIGADGCLYSNNTKVITSDTKNTAGSTNLNNKLFLIGAPTQADNPQTYSRSTCYIGIDGYLYSNGTKVDPGKVDSSNLASTKLFLIGAASQGGSVATNSYSKCYIGPDGHLYSNSIQVVTLSGSQALTGKTYNGYTLAAACAKGVSNAVLDLDNASSDKVTSETTIAYLAKNKLTRKIAKSATSITFPFQRAILTMDDHLTNRGMVMAYATLISTTTPKWMIIAVIGNGGDGTASVQYIVTDGATATFTLPNRTYTLTWADGEATLSSGSTSAYLCAISVNATE